MRSVNAPVLGIACAALALAAGAAAAPMSVTVTITNLQPANGNNLAPASFIAHNGTFDWFNAGQPGAEWVERLAEDGMNAQLITQAANSPGFGAAAHTPGGGIMPGESRTVTLTLDPASANDRFLSFGAMFVPSNDAFIGNDNPTAFPLFNAQGGLIVRDGASAIIIDGPNGVWDAGRELNDEVPMHLPGVDQPAPNMGPDENGVVRLHPGFMGSQRLGGAPGTILTLHPGADFTAPGALVARITVVPAPAALSTLALGLLARRRRR